MVLISDILRRGIRKVNGFVRVNMKVLIKIKLNLWLTAPKGATPVN